MDDRVKDALRIATQYDTGPKEGEATLKPYEPTLREKIYQLLAGTEKRPTAERANFARGVANMAEFAPGVGNVMGAQEALRQGDNKGAALAMLPIPGVSAEARAAKAALEPAEEAAKKAIRAYHFSPNAFERFEPGHAGTGSGGASFGRGTGYFGAREEDARFWQNKINKERGLPEGSGHMYEVELKADPERMIDYNKYLHEQSDFVKDALQNKLGYDAPSWFKPPAEGEFGGHKPRGEMVLPTSESAARAFREAGIHGVKYYDPGNMYHGYVTFDEDPATILRRYADGGLVPNDDIIERKEWSPFSGLKIRPPAEKLSSEPDIRDYQLKRHDYEFEGGEEPTAPRRKVMLNAPALGGKKELGEVPYFFADPINTALNLAYGLKTAPLYSNPYTAPVGRAIDAYETAKKIEEKPEDITSFAGAPKILRGAGPLGLLGIGAGILATDTDEDKQREDKGMADGGIIERALRIARDAGGGIDKEIYNWRMKRAMKGRSKKYNPWLDTENMYTYPTDERHDPKDPAYHVSPEEFKRGNLGQGRYALADGGEPSSASKSSEEDPNVSLLNDIYQQNLGRPADKEAITYWGNLLNKGIDPSQIENAIANTEEAENHNYVQFVNDEYQGLLGRNPNQNELAIHLKDLKSGILDQNTFDQALSNSEESQLYQASNFDPYDIASSTGIPAKNAPRTTLQVNNQIDALMRQQPLQVQLAALLRQEGEQYLTNLNPNNIKELAAIGYTPFTRAAAGFKENAGKKGFYKGWFNTNDPSNPSSQILAPAAYSAMKTQGAKEGRRGLSIVKDLLSNPDDSINKAAMDIANRIITQQIPNPTPGATNYLNPHVYKSQPGWTSTLAGSKIGTASDIGKHIYYTNPLYKDAINKNLNVVFAQAQGKPTTQFAGATGTTTPGAGMDPTIAIAADKAAWQQKRDAYIADRVSKSLPPTLPPELTNYTPGAGGTMTAGTGTAAAPGGIPAGVVGQDLAQQGAGGNAAVTTMVNPGGAPVGGAPVITGPYVDPNAAWGTQQMADQTLQGILDKNRQQQTDLFRQTQTQIGNYDPFTGQVGNTSWDPMTGVGIHSSGYQGPGQYGAVSNFNPSGVTGYVPPTLPPGVFAFKHGGAVKPDDEDVENALRLARRKGGRINTKIDKDPDFDMSVSLASGGRSPAWTRKEGQNPAGGLNAKGRASAKAEGSNLKPPAPHPKTDEAAARRKSFCARMKGMKAKLTSSETANDPDSRINKSLRVWNCHSDGGAVDNALRLAKGGDIWDKPRAKGLGEPKPLSKAQKKSAKASAKAAGRPYPNLVDNMRAAQRKK